MRVTFLFLFIALIFVSLPSSAQRLKVKRKGVKMVDVTKPSNNTSSWSLKQFEGKWQEVFRKDRQNNSTVDFTDTLFLHFYGDSEVSVRDGINLSVKGSAEIQPGNILAVAGDEFIIKSLDKIKAVLDDGDKYIHTIIKMKSFWFETLPTDSIVPENFVTPVTVSLSYISGKWIVYRRDARPGATATDEALIQVITIENKGKDAFGEITFYQAGKTETLPCSITTEGTRLNIVTAKRSWQMDVYKEGEKELIFGSPTLMYYCKQL